MALNNLLDLKNRPCKTCGVVHYVVTPTYECLGCFVKSHKYQQEWTERKQVYPNEVYDKLHNTITKNEAERLLHLHSTDTGGGKTEKTEVSILPHQRKQKNWIK